MDSLKATSFVLALFVVSAIILFAIFGLSKAIWVVIRRKSFFAIGFYCHFNAWNYLSVNETLGRLSRELNEAFENVVATQSQLQDQLKTVGPASDEGWRLAEELKLAWREVNRRQRSLDRARGWALLSGFGREVTFSIRKRGEHAVTR
ncbi:MAG: hypothetical protein HYT39_00830 [Candidatus Sungbacteria bacterium]|nr:hypothetical protein [Candidatus Sungbacteria bacterium]